MGETQDGLARATLRRVVNPHETIGQATIRFHLEARARAETVLDTEEHRWGTPHRIWRKEFARLNVALNPQICPGNVMGTT